MRFKKDIMHKKVRIKKTGEIAYIVWYNDDYDKDSFLLDIADKNQMPDFYERADFEFLEPIE